MEEQYNRAAEDVGNVIEIGHVNICVVNQQAATDFYVSGLGLTRDPYLVTGTNNMWINVGRHQFHLPTAERPQRLRGTIGLVVPDLDALRVRLAGVRRLLGGSAFAFTDGDGTVEVTCPWGNRFRMHAPSPELGPFTLGLAYLEFDVAPGSAPAIARFYREIFGTPGTLTDGKRTARVHTGEQELVFRETDQPAEPYDGYHIQVYVADFSAPYRKLGKRGLVTREDGVHQYRFLEIVNPEDGQPALTLEHEVRSLRHPLYGRHLVNRNTAIDLATYAPGHEAYAWASR